MRETHVVYKIQPETRIRKDLQFKKEYAALQKKINIRQGLELDLGPMPKEIVAAARKEGVRELVELMTAHGSNVEIQTWSCRALGDIARDAMSPTKEHTGKPPSARKVSYSDN